MICYNLASTFPGDWRRLPRHPRHSPTQPAGATQGQLRLLVSVLVAPRLVHQHLTWSWSSISRLNWSWSWFTLPCLYTTFSCTLLSDQLSVQHYNPVTRKVNFLPTYLAWMKQIVISLPLFVIQEDLWLYTLRGQTMILRMLAMMLGNVQIFTSKHRWKALKWGLCSLLEMDTCFSFKIIITAPLWMFH